MTAVKIVTVVYHGPYGGVVTPDGTVFNNGERVEIPASLAQDLERSGDFTRVDDTNENKDD